MKLNMFDLSLLKEEAEVSSETLLPLYLTTWRYIPRGTNLNTHCIENFKSHTFQLLIDLYWLSFILGRMKGLLRIMWEPRTMSYIKV